MRSAGLPDAIRSVLRMKRWNTAVSETLPFVRLSEWLRYVMKRAVDDIESAVMATGIAPSLSGAAVSDHLLTGIAENVFTVFFQELGSDALRGIFELHILSCSK